MLRPPPSARRRKYWVSRYINGGSVECGVCGVSEYCLANPSNPAPSTFRYELTTSTWYCPIHLPAYQTNVDEEGEGNKGYVGKFTVGNGLQGNLHCAECGGEVECEVLRKAKMEVRQYWHEGDEPRVEERSDSNIAYQQNIQPHRYTPSPSLLIRLKAFNSSLRSSPRPLRSTTLSHQVTATSKTTTWKGGVRGGACSPPPP